VKGGVLSRALLDRQRALLVRGLNALAATVCTPLGAPVIAAARLRGIIRIIKQHPQPAEAATSALRGIHAADLQPGAILLFQPADLAVFGDVLRHWLSLAQPGPVRAALTSVLGGQA
jgi:hypothetical protein